MPPNPYPLVVRVMLAFKAALLNNEADQIEEMARKWTQLETSLQGSFDALAFELDGLRRDGETITISKLIRMERYRSLLGQVNQQLDFYSFYAADRIRTGQLEMLSLGIQHAVEAIKSYFVTRGKDTVVDPSTATCAFSVLKLAGVIVKRTASPPGRNSGQK